MRSRNRSSRSVANRRGSWPASITDSTAPNSAAASPAASASTDSSISARSVAPSRASARWYTTRFPSAPASSWSSTDSVSRGEPPPARITSGYTASSTSTFSCAQMRSSRPAHGLGRQQPERVVMGARPDGRQHLLRLGGGEHEDEVFGWLLDDLEQRVETRGGHHVRFVDDEDAVSRLGGRVERSVAELTGVVDAAVAGRVEFDDVDVAGAVGRQRDAGVAHPARGGGRALLAVQRARQDARRRRLAAAPRAGEQVGVVDPAGRQRRRQWLGDVLLADHFAERRGPVLAVESHGEQATQPQ